MPLAAGLLGTHVRRGSSQPTADSEVLIRKCETEVGDERLPRAINQNIGGLDVAVNQAVSMSVMKGFGDSRHQCRRLVKTRA